MPANKDDVFSRVTIPDTVETAGDARPLENVGDGDLLVYRDSAGLAALLIEADKLENVSKS